MHKEFLQKMPNVSLILLDKLPIKNNFTIFFEEFQNIIVDKLEIPYSLD